MGNEKYSNALKFCEVSQNSKSKRGGKFQLLSWQNKKVLCIPKNYMKCT